VDHVTVYRWVQRFTPQFIEAARPCRHAPGDGWFADETYLKVAGKWTYLYQAVDQYGQVIDVLRADRRDLDAARRFFTRALQAGTVPAEVTTDRARPTHGSLTSWPPRRCTSLSGTRTTPSRRTTGGSKHGCGRCAA
jgi:IS6 family transposase